MGFALAPDDPCRGKAVVLGCTCGIIECWFLQVQITVLDDVVTSVDTNHRRQFCKLLKDAFPDVQFIITTHDEVWARQMQSSGLVGRRSLARSMDGRLMAVRSTGKVRTSGLRSRLTSRVTTCLAQPTSSAATSRQSFQTSPPAFRARSCSAQTTTTT